MNRTPLRARMLLQVADGPLDRGLTDSWIFTTMINERLVECHGAARYRLTPDGADLLAAWHPDDPAGDRLAATLAHHPGLLVGRSRHMHRCAGADPHTGWTVEIECAPDGRATIGPTITHRTHLVLSGTGGRAHAEALRDANPDRVTITGVPNPHHHPDCRGDIPPGALHVEWFGAAQPGQTGIRLCPTCATTL